MARHCRVPFGDTLQPLADAKLVAARLELEHLRIDADLLGVEPVDLAVQVVVMVHIELGHLARGRRQIDPCLALRENVDDLGADPFLVLEAGGRVVRLERRIVREIRLALDRVQRATGDGGDLGARCLEGAEPVAQLLRRQRINVPRNGLLFAEIETRELGCLARVLFTGVGGGPWYAERVAHSFKAHAHRRRSGTAQHLAAEGSLRECRIATRFAGAHAGAAKSAEPAAECTGDADRHRHVAIRMP